MKNASNWELKIDLNDILLDRIHFDETCKGTPLGCQEDEQIKTSLELA